MGFVKEIHKIENITDGEVLDFVFGDLQDKIHPFNINQTLKIKKWAKYIISINFQDPDACNTFKEMRRWLKNNVKHRYTYFFVMIWFESDADLMLFKLRWM